MRRSLPDLLGDRIAAEAPGAICVGFSGGPDSTALLHALAELPEARFRGVRALHVDHGLQPQSADWARHCAGFCAGLDVPLESFRVVVDRGRGDGLEAAARRARYRVFADALQPGEWLALAHHRDDQIETVLLKLLRGAGPEGLGGMRALRPFARGYLWRPLLDVPRVELQAYLVEHQVRSIDDPANHDPGFARNVIRAEVLPLLRRRWSHAGTAILHSAALCAGAARHLADSAAVAMTTLVRPDRTLALAGWLALPEVLAAAVLDRWLHGLGLPTPPDAARRELRFQSTRTLDGKVPCVRWPGAEVHAWDHRLFALPPLAAPPPDWIAHWNGAPLALPTGCGTLTLVNSTGIGPSSYIDPPLTIRFRQGGERLRPSGDLHQRELGELFQQARVPPWLRDRCPLLFAGDELVAVADLWTSARGAQTLAAAGGQLRWTRPAWTRRAHRL